MKISEQTSWIEKDIAENISNIPGEITPILINAKQTWKYFVHKILACNSHVLLIQTKQKPYLRKVYKETDFQKLMLVVEDHLDLQYVIGTGEKRFIHGDTDYSNYKKRQ